MRPTLIFLDKKLKEQIISEAMTILSKLGVEIHNESVLSMLSDHGAQIDSSKHHAILTEELIEKSLSTALSSFKLYDIFGNETHDFSENEVYFTPGSAALNILDFDTNTMRKPITDDYIKYVKIVNQLEYIASQSTAFIPSDIQENISDSYRLFLSLLYGEKPVVTGTFTIESFYIMKELQLAIRGTEESLMQKPLTVFSCCPTSPLKWSDVTSQNVVDCARSRIPVEFISMPLSGFMAPVSLVGTLIQHTAETMSGIVVVLLPYLMCVMKPRPWGPSKP
jgi:trimethylamine--corrinoid protein Co-methyltransferase